MKKRQRRKLRNQQRRKKIEMSLTPESIQDTIDYLKDYRAGVVAASKEVAETIGELGVETARSKIIEYGAVNTTELLTSIRYEIHEIGGRYYVRILADAPYFEFVEFGTGIVGAMSPKHPLHGEVGWEHDKNGHGFDGWYYKGDDGQIHHTWGQPARPFLYDTVAELEASIPEIIEKVFK